MRQRQDEGGQIISSDLPLFSSLGAGWFGGHLRGSHRFAVITPGAALVFDDVGDIGIAEQAGEWRHGTGDTTPPAFAPCIPLRTTSMYFAASCLLTTALPSSFARIACGPQKSSHAQAGARKYW